MPTLRQPLLCLIALFAAGFSIAIAASGQETPSATATSPNGQITLQLFAADGADDDMRFAVDFHGKGLIAASKLGLEFAGQPALGPGMRKTGEQPESVDESYTIPVG